MLNRVLITAVSTILLLSAAFATAQTSNAALTGTVTFRERVALPSDAVIDVQLIDASVADIAAQTVAEVLINAEGRQVPVPFTLTYDPAKIEPGHRYSARATIRSGDGMLMFSTTQAYPVLTHGTPSKVNLILHTVGHGAKPGIAAKKQPTPAASDEATATSQPTPPAASEPVSPAMTAPQPAGEPATSAMSAAAPEPEKAPAQPEAKPAPADTVAASTTTSPPATTPEAATAQPDKPAEAPAAPEATAPTPESKASQPTAPTPDLKAAEPEAPLPEAPSASKHIESVPPAPEGASTAKGESTSRPERPAPNKADTPLADTQWKLVQLNGQDVVIAPLQKPMTLAFSPEGRRIAGSAGCNSYLGTFSDDHGLLHLNPGSMTMLLCADAAGSREKKFVAMLRSADGYKMSGDVLLLTSNGKTVAKFKTNPPL